jgi:hypothetical protein
MIPNVMIVCTAGAEACHTVHTVAEVEDFFKHF